MQFRKFSFEILALAVTLGTAGCAAGAVDESEQESELGDVNEATDTTEQGACVQTHIAHSNSTSCMTKAKLKTEADGWCVILGEGYPSTCRGYHDYCGTVGGVSYYHSVWFAC